VPPGTRHAFRNRSDAPTRIRADVRPPSTLQEFLEDVAALSRAGKLTRFGVPKPSGMLEGAVLADTYADMVELGFPLPPVAVQRVLLKPLAKLARRRGVRAGGFAQIAQSNGSRSARESRRTERIRAIKRQRLHARKGEARRPSDAGEAAAKIWQSGSVRTRS
jgi:hypothetical protein